MHAQPDDRPQHHEAPEPHDRPAGEGPEADIDRLSKDIAEAQQRYLRVLAEFQNFQRRALDNERHARHEGVAAVVRALIPALDHLEVALASASAASTAEQVLAGVRSIRDEVIKGLAGGGVTIIQPAPNDEFDPARHEALLQQHADDVEPGRVVRTLQTGYAMGDRLIRPAKVAVAPGA